MKTANPGQKAQKIATTETEARPLENCCHQELFDCSVRILLILKPRKDADAAKSIPTETIRGLDLLWPFFRT
jgi:hypothetical protein